MQRTALVVAALVGAAGPALGQSDFWAAQALIVSPIGAITPLMSPGMIGRHLDGVQLAFRYSYRQEDPDIYTQGGALTATFSPSLRSSVSISAGMRDANCTSCAGQPMLGAGADMRVYEGANFVGRGTGVSLSVSGDVGYGRLTGSGLNAFSLGIGTPVTASYANGGQEALHVVAFATPIFGIGQVNDAGCLIPGCDSDPNGTRFVLGGGLGIWNPMTSLSAFIGLNRVMDESQKTIYGVGIVIGGRRFDQ
jgi:hypothetical protein